MRRVAAYAMAAVLVLVLAVAGLARWPLDPLRAEAALDDALGRAAQLRWRAPESASLSLLPRPTLRISGAELDDLGGTSVLSAQAARFPLALAPLLAGRFEAEGAEIERPTLTIDLDRPPALAARAGAGAPRAASAIDRLRLRGGLLRVVGAAQGFDTLLDGVDGALEGLGGGGPLRFDLAAVWRGQRVALSGALDAPDEAAKGTPESFALTLSAAPGAFSLAGALTGGGAPAFVGDVAIDVTSASALARWLALPTPDFFAAETFGLKAKARADGKVVALDEADLDVGGQVLEGALALTADNGRLTISGTLAADQLSLAAIFGPAPTFREPTGAWSRTPLSFRPPEAFDLDLRLSATRLDVYGHRLDGAAGSAMANDGRLTATLADAAAYDGRIRGEVTAESAAGGLRLHTSGAATGDLGALLADFGWRGNSGRGALDFSFDAGGASPADLVAGLSGAASLGAAEGTVAGINLEEALRRGQRHALDPSRDLRPGGTAYASLRAKLGVAGGRAAILEGALDSPAVAARAEGAIDIAGQAWRTRIVARQADADGAPASDRERLSFSVDGPWLSPRVSIGLESE